MKYAIASEHLTYFEKHRRVELEGLLSHEQLQKLNESIEECLSPILGVTKEKVYSVRGERLFAAAHDVWRKDPQLRKLLLSPSWGTIVAELIDKKIIRLGYDQLLPTNAQLVGVPLPLTLQQLCYFQGVLGGMMIALTDNPWVSEGSILPKKSGNVIFFDADQEIPFHELEAEVSKGLFLMVVFVGQTSLYVKQTNDPHVHAPRDLGYAFGDRLRDDRHPIVHRAL